MRLGFHYHVPAVIEAGQIRMPAFQGRFVDALADECSEVICFLHSPLQEEWLRMDYVLRSRNVRLVGLGPHSSVPRRLLRARKCARVLASQRSSLDVVLLRGPS